MANFPIPFPYGCCPVLDKPCGIVNPEDPQSNRRNRRLCRAPHGEKSGLFVLATSAPRGRGYILARRRPDVRETQAALLGPGSVVSRPFLFKPPKPSRWLMDIQKFRVVRQRLNSLLAGVEQSILEDQRLESLLYGMKDSGRMCPAWEDFRVFRKWARQNGIQRKGARLVLLDKVAGYSPENCIITANAKD